MTELFAVLMTLLAMNFYLVGIPGYTKSSKSGLIPICQAKKIYIDGKNQTHHEKYQQ